jgi:disulfide bond formation protein DsbB
MINKRRDFQMKKTLLPIPAVLLFLALVVSACGGSSAPTEPPPTPAPAGDPAKGEELFVTCAACHGPEGEGVAGLGKDMTTSEFIASKSDDELVEFIKVGRAPDDTLNTTGVAMLPKGGNPALSDEDLYDIVAYIRTLHK